MSALKLFLFGPPRVELDGTLVEIQRRKALALLIYLAVSRQPHSRDALATLFYPDHSQSRARSYLRRDLAVLNTTLASEWLDTDRDTVELRHNDDHAPDPGQTLWLDVARFRACLAACRQHDHPAHASCTDCLPLLTEAIELYTDDFLAGFTLRDCPEFDDWQFFQAESLRQELGAALEQLVLGCSQTGKPDVAVPYARRWVALDPLHEPAQRALIQLYDQAGQPSAALRQYEDYVALLEAELGLPPEEETRTLSEAIKAKRLLRPYLKAEEGRRSRAAEEPSDAQPAARQPPQPAAAHADVRPTPPPPDSASSVSIKTPPHPTAPKTQTVGRETELAQLHTLLNTALQGKRQLVFVTGEAGQGKTTLIETFLEQARAGTSLWIGQGQCIEHRGPGEAYMPVLEAFSRMCQEPGGQTLVDLLARVAPTWLVQMPWLVDTEELERLQDKVQASTRDRMLREMVEAVEIMTVKRPLILVLEDLHWSDYSTLDLLTALARRQESASLLVIGTYRPADVKMIDHPLSGLVQEIQVLEQGTELPLPSLSEAAVGDYLLRRFANMTLPAGLVALLHQRTGGNPLFVRAVVDAWVAQGLLAERNGQWTLLAELDGLGVGLPNNLRRLIELQLIRLDTANQNILEVASVVGTEFAAAALAAGLTMTEEEIEARCEILAQQGQFLHASGLAEWPDGTVSACFEFSHQLYQEVLYERVTTGRRVRLHRQIGRRLEQGYGSRAPEKATELALHFGQGRDSSRAVTYLRFAAEQAMQRNAYREAIEHVTQALDILARHSDLPERDQHELALQLILGPARLMTQGWTSVEAEQAYIRARELGHVSNTRQLATALYGLATVYELRGEYIKTQKILEERLQLPRDPDDPRLQLESHELLACSTFHQGDFVEALNHADQALTFCTPAGAEPLTPLLGEDPSVSSYHWAGLALWFLGYPDQAVARSQTALNEAKDLGYTFGLAHAQEQAAMIHQLRCEELMVEERAENTIAAAKQGGFAYWVGVGKILWGWSLAVQGQTEPGLAQLHEGLQICQRTGATIDHPYFLSLLADAYSRAGQVTEGLDALAEALSLARKSQKFFYEAELYRLRGMLLLQADATANVAEAEASFQQALAVARDQQARSLELRAAVSLARLWQEQGKTAEARDQLAEIYSWFSEGFDTIDLQEARSLLEQLGAEAPREGAGTTPLSPVSPAPPSPAPEQKLEQQIRYCRTPAGVRLAYATVGSGPPLVKAANWLSHLEYDWQSPVWQHWLEGLAQHHTLIRYDKRGCGLSDRAVDDFSLQAQVEDLETVVDALGLKQFPLLGLSGGGPVAIAYAARHPEKVSCLILYGSYVLGRLKRSQSIEQLEETQMLFKVMELGWGKANPAFRQLYTGLFIPEGTAEQIRWFNELQRMSTTPETAVRMFIASSSVDVSDLAPQVNAPTLILHGRHDALTPIEQSQELARLIPNTRFVPLDSKNHILLEHEPAWPQFLDEVHQFIQSQMAEAVHSQQVLTASRESIENSRPASSAGPVGPRFVQEKLIATGGMGQVYLGRDTGTGQPVAIKQLKPELVAHNPEAVKRISREGQILQQLSHPNIVKVLATFENEGQPAIVMEYVPGGSLQDLLNEQPQLPVEQAIDLALELADALARTHHLGVIHRDIKPGNILLAADGTPRLTDFGVAYLAQQDTRLTQIGAILGTTVYMSPEAWRGEDLDGRSDIWSFGAVLYEMLAGQPPFAASQPVAIMTAILNDPLPDLYQFRPDAPPALVELIKQMLVKNREHRLDSMRQVAAGLEVIRRSVVMAQ